MICAVSAYRHQRQDLASHTKIRHGSRHTCAVSLEVLDPLATLFTPSRAALEVVLPRHRLRYILSNVPSRSHRMFHCMFHGMFD